MEDKYIACSATRIGIRGRRFSSQYLPERSILSHTRSWQAVMKHIGNAGSGWGTSGDWIPA